VEQAGVMGWVERDGAIGWEERGEQDGAMGWAEKALARAALSPRASPHTAGRASVIPGASARR
jgi:hypothetical protein